MLVQEFRHRRPLALLLPFLVIAVLGPMLIGHCGVTKAAARPLPAPRAWPGAELPPVMLPGAAGLPAVAPVALPTPPPAAEAAPIVDLDHIRLERGRYVGTAADGRTVELTLDPALQKRADEVLRRAGVAYGAAVFVSIPDGKVLAMTGRSRLEPQRTVTDLTLRPWAPAASVFKVITSAALLDGRKVKADGRVCYHGGGGRLLRENIEDRPRLDRRCADLAHAVGLSTNSIIAKLAHRHLDPDTLRRYVDAFGFNAGLQPSAAFPFEVAASPAEVPSEDLEFARTAAGFWHVFLSPLHGARIASAFANAGLMVGPRLVERVRGLDGQVTEPRAPEPVRVIPADVARDVGRMMVGTTRFGTARGAFAGGGRRRLGYEVAGKTGSLSRAKPYTHYNWFVGFAPAGHPQVAFGVIVGTDGRNIKAAEVAREVLKEAALKDGRSNTLMARK
ncbi:MAG TPA: penicillin-binding transpeptidase domain-containing protein [Polyangia bacterium]|jgi:cell division protein FtsI/penicillin-binding protein 2